MSTLRISWHDEPGNDFNNYKQSDFDIELFPDPDGAWIFIEYPNPTRDDEVFGPVMQVSVEALIDALVALGWDADLLRRSQPAGLLDPLTAGPKLRGS